MNSGKRNKEAEQVSDPEHNDDDNNPVQDRFDA
jgi:hypothetical protein